MKIYLAGKMDAKHGAWRDAILERQRDDYGQRAPYWERVVSSQEGDIDLADLGVPPWPRTPNTRVLGLHDYVGPYRTTYTPEIDSKYTGYFHGSTVTGQHGQSNWNDHPAIVQECWKAINRADMFFAYINSPDCFGTLAEMGMAKARGVYVVGAFETDAEWEWSDYWFCGHLCDAVIRVPDPIVVGAEPPRPTWSTLRDDEWGTAHEVHAAWERRGDAETERIRGLMREAILQWTARPETPAPVALVKQDDSERLLYALREAAQSFSQISRWSADPRVRNEAARMLKRIAG